MSPRHGSSARDNRWVLWVTLAFAAVSLGSGGLLVALGQPLAALVAAAAAIGAAAAVARAARRRRDERFPKDER